MSNYIDNFIIKTNNSSNDTGKYPNQIAFSSRHVYRSGTTHLVGNSGNSLQPGIEDEAVIKDNLGKKLQRYIDRIELHRAGNGSPVYSHGFYFFKQSRAKNRAANYKLAVKLRDELESSLPVSHIFSELETKRCSIFNELFPQSNKNRGINSHELSQVIEEANRSFK